MTSDLLTYLAAVSPVVLIIGGLIGLYISILWLLFPWLVLRRLKSMEGWIKDIVQMQAHDILDKDTKK